MAIERESTRTATLDVLERVLDKGIVIDAWAKISVAGIELIGIDWRMMVMSIDTYLRFADTLEARAPLTVRAPVTVEVVAPVGAPTVDAPRPQRRRRPRATEPPAIVVRCENGCGFAPRRRRLAADARCPYDGGRLSQAPAA